MKKTKQRLTGILMIVAAVILFLCQQAGILPKPESASSPAAAITQSTEASDQSADAPITAPQDIANYLFAHGELPDNFITKKEAEALGWDSSVNDVSDVAPGKSIGGDRFGNYEGRLPKVKGRVYYECDCNYVSGNRGAERIIYTRDGLVYYTADHYQTFTEMSPGD